MEGPLAERALLFELAGRSYGLRIGSIEGLGEADSIRAVAGAPPFVLGLCEWRGRLLTVVDLPALLGTGGLEAAAGERPAAPCLVRLAAPLDRTALYVPAAVRLGWTAAEPGTPGAGPVHAVNPVSAPEGERENPQFLEPRTLIRSLASAMGG
jgi:hypothetical protein